MELFVKIVNDFQTLTTFAKNFILHIWLDSEYTPDHCFVKASCFFQGWPVGTSILEKCNDCSYINLIENNCFHFNWDLPNNSLALKLLSFLGIFPKIQELWSSEFSPYIYLYKNKLYKNNEAETGKK